MQVKKQKINVNTINMNTSQASNNNNTDSNNNSNSKANGSRNGINNSNQTILGLGNLVNTYLFKSNNSVNNINNNHNDNGKNTEKERDETERESASKPITTSARASTSSNSAPPIPYSSGRTLGQVGTSHPLATSTTLSLPDDSDDEDAEAAAEISDAAIEKTTKKAGKKSLTKKVKKSKKKSSKNRPRVSQMSYGSVQNLLAAILLEKNNNNNKKRNKGGAAVKYPGFGSGTSLTSSSKQQVVIVRSNLVTKQIWISPLAPLTDQDIVQRIVDGVLPLLVLPQIIEDDNENNGNDEEDKNTLENSEWRKAEKRESASDYESESAATLYQFKPTIPLNDNGENNDNNESTREGERGLIGNNEDISSSNETETLMKISNLAGNPSKSGVLFAASLGSRASSESGLNASSAKNNASRKSVEKNQLKPFVSFALNCQNAYEVDSAMRKGTMVIHLKRSCHALKYQASHLGRGLRKLLVYGMFSSLLGWILVIILWYQSRRVSKRAGLQRMLLSWLNFSIAYILKPSLVNQSGGVGSSSLDSITEDNHTSDLSERLIRIINNNPGNMMKLSNNYSAASSSSITSTTLGPNLSLPFKAWILPFLVSLASTASSITFSIWHYLKSRSTPLMASCVDYEYFELPIIIMDQEEKNEGDEHNQRESFSTSVGESTTSADDKKGGGGGVDEDEEIVDSNHRKLYPFHSFGRKTASQISIATSSHFSNSAIQKKKKTPQTQPPNQQPPQRQQQPQQKEQSPDTPNIRNPLEYEAFLIRHDCILPASERNNTSNTSSTNKTIATRSGGAARVVRYSGWNWPFYISTVGLSYCFGSLVGLFGSGGPDGSGTSGIASILGASSTQDVLVD